MCRKSDAQCQTNCRRLRRRNPSYNATDYVETNSSTGYVKSDRSALYVRKNSQTSSMRTEKEKFKDLIECKKFGKEESK